MPLPSRSLILLAALTMLVPTLARTDESVQQKLFHAVIQDERDEVANLLKIGGNPNTRTTPAQEDAWSLQYQNDDDPSPPIIVVASRYTSIHGDGLFRLLLDHNADVNLADRNGVTPLMAAAGIGGNIPALLEHSVRVNAKDKSGRTALFYAINNRGLNTVAKLIEKGADLNVRDTNGMTPLMVAVVSAASDPIRLPIPEGDLESRGSAKRDEARERYLELLRFLVSKKADLSIRDNTGRTARDMALANHDADAARLLARRGSASGR